MSEPTVDWTVLFAALTKLALREPSQSLRGIHEVMDIVSDIVSDRDNWKRCAEWRKENAGRYEDIREWLRLFPRENAAEFYDECCKVVFPDQYPGEGDAS
ncbi:hypothetical protein [Tsukamurella soli]|uniref:Uncharacterized protein n=1 Tax=Tsukamurella soli TaxID=644556 RepID=A0ABP8JJ37_9ACTN